MIFEAALQGVDVTKTEGETPVENKLKTDEKEIFFKDPSAYEHMSREEKEKETRRIKGILSQMIYDPEKKCSAPKKIFSGMRV